MPTSTISIRIPEKIRREIDEFTDREHLSQVSESVRKLLLLGLERWREQRAVELLESGDITFNEAAQIARMDVWSFADLLERTERIWVRPDLEDVRGEIEDALE